MAGKVLRTLGVVLILASVLVACGGVSPEQLRKGGAASGPMTQVTLNNISREKSLDYIGTVMKSHGFQANS
jgi:hypothetical protein